MARLQERYNKEIVPQLGKKLGRVSPEELNQLIEGLNEIVGG